MDADRRPPAGGAAERPDLEKRLTPAAPPGTGARPDTDPPKLVIVRKGDAAGPARDPNGPWQGSHFQTTTIRASSLPAKLTAAAADVVPLPPAPAPPSTAAPGPAPTVAPAGPPAKPGLQLQKPAAKAEPEDNRASLPKGPRHPDAGRRGSMASLHAFRVLASLLFAAAALLLVTVLMLKFGGAIVPAPAWRGYAIWGLSGMLILGLVFRLGAVQVLSGVMAFLGAVAIAGAIGASISPDGLLPFGAEAVLVPFSHAVALTFAASAALVAATGQGWLRLGGVLLLSAAAGAALVLGGLGDVALLGRRPSPAPAPAPARPGGQLIATEEFQFSLPPEWIDRRSPEAPALPQEGQSLLFTSQSGRVSLALERRPVQPGFDPATVAQEILGEYRRQDEAAEGIVINVRDPAETRRVFLISGDHTTEVVVRPARRAVYILSFRGLRTDVQQERGAIDRIIATFQPR